MEMRVKAGENIYRTARQAFSLAKYDIDGVVTFEFNGVVLEVREDSDYKQVLRDYMDRKHLGR